jgi:hypothetical protein
MWASTKAVIALFWVVTLSFSSFSALTLADLKAPTIAVCNLVKFAILVSLE